MFRALTVEHVTGWPVAFDRVPYWLNLFTFR